MVINLLLNGMILQVYHQILHPFRQNLRPLSFTSQRIDWFWWAQACMGGHLDDCSGWKGGGRVFWEKKSCSEAEKSKERWWKRWKKARMPHAWHVFLNKFTETNKWFIDSGGWCVSWWANEQKMALMCSAHVSCSQYAIQQHHHTRMWLFWMCCNQSVRYFTTSLAHPKSGFLAFHKIVVHALTPETSVRADEASNNVSGVCTMLSRHAVQNFEQFLAAQSGAATWKQLRRNQLALAKKEFSRLAPELHNLDPDFIDLLGAQAEGFLRRTLNKFSMISMTKNLPSLEA